MPQGTTYVTGGSGVRQGGYSTTGYVTGNSGVRQVQ